MSDKLIDIINTDDEPNILGDKNFGTMNLKEELEQAIKSGWIYIPKPTLDETTLRCEQVCLRYVIGVLDDLNVADKIEELKAKLK